MQIHKIDPLGFASNCYFVTEDGVNAIAIDPGQPRALEQAENLGLRVKYVLLTHGHFDHIGGVSTLQQSGAEVGCLKGEDELATRNNLGEMFGRVVPPFSIDFTFSDGDVLELLGMRVAVMGTPGHTAGSCCYLISSSKPFSLEGEKAAPKATDEGCLYSLFTGDTLFAGDVGRTDLPTGNSGQLAASLAKLFALEGEYAVFPGHGELTDLARERNFRTKHKK